MEEERKYDKLVDDAKEYAYECLRNFFRNIGLNPELFPHLFNVPIEIDYTEDITEGAPALFDPNDKNGEGKIYIGIDHLDEMYDYLEEGKKYSSIIANLSLSIVHELIHMARVVTLKEETTAISASTRIIKELNIYHDTYKKIKDFDDILILSTLRNKNRQYVPIKVYIYNKNIYTLIVYNKKTCSYEVYEKQKFASVFHGNFDRFMLSLCSELQLHFTHIPTTRYPSILMSEYRSRNIYNAMDLYHQPLKRKFKNVKTKQGVLNTLSTIKTQINQQVSLEEAITESLATMIVMNKKNNYFDPKELSSIIAASDTSYSDEKCAAALISNMGIDMIRTFFLAPYSDEYTDIFSKYFEEDYDKALELFDILYEDSKADIESDPNIEQELMSIINSKKTELLI